MTEEEYELLFSEFLMPDVLYEYLWIMYSILLYLSFINSEEIRECYFDSVIWSTVAYLGVCFFLFRCRIFLSVYLSGYVNRLSVYISI